VVRTPSALGAPAGAATPPTDPQPAAA
jgi:hypothetical protein